MYLDHAATTPLDLSVLQKMIPYFAETFGNADSPHTLGRKAMGAVDAARDTVAELIGAKKNEVYFTSGGTEADNWAIIGGARAKRAEGKNKIVLSAIELHAALSAAEQLAKDGFEIVYLPVNAGGRVELTALSSAIDERTALVCLMTANNETGVLQPVQDGVKLAHEKGALFFTDAVQAAPYMPIDVRELGVDMLSFSGHKFYGPKGVGALYIKSGVKVEKLIGGGEQERGLRGGTVNVPLVVGFAEAYKKIRREMTENTQKLQTLSALFEEELYARLANVDGFGGVTLNGERQNKIPSVLNLRFCGIENTALLFNLDLRGVCVAAGSACASASVKPSHVLTAMGMDEKTAKECIRISIGKDNTEAEMRRAAATIAEVIGKLAALAKK